METQAYVDAVVADLTRLADLGGEEASAAARAITAALEASLGLRLLDALSEAALELGTQLPSGHVEVRLAGRDPQLVYVEEEDAVPAADAVEEGMAARITLRLPDSLKAQLEAAAARERVSVNTWLVRALTRAVTATPPRRSRNLLTGFAES